MPTSELVASAFGAVPSVVRISPVADRWPYIQAAVSLGNALILLQSASDVRIVVNRLRRMGVNVGEYSKDWAVGLSGGTVVGNRSAALDYRGIIINPPPLRKKQNFGKGGG